MWGKITLGAAVLTAGVIANFGLKQMAKALIKRGDVFLRNAELTEIDVEGEKIKALVVTVPAQIKTMLPVMTPRNRPSLRPYVRGLNSLYFSGQLTEGGVYAIEARNDNGSTFRLGEYHLYALFPIEKDEDASAVSAEELVEEPQS